MTYWIALTRKCGTGLNLSCAQNRYLSYLCYNIKAMCYTIYMNPVLREWPERVLLGKCILFISTYNKPIETTTTRTHVYDEMNTRGGAAADVPKVCALGRPFVHPLRGIRCALYSSHACAWSFVRTLQLHTNSKNEPTYTTERNLQIYTVQCVFDMKLQALRAARMNDLSGFYFCLNVRELCARAKSRDAHRSGRLMGDGSKTKVGVSVWDGSHRMLREAEEDDSCMENEKPTGKWRIFTTDTMHAMLYWI